MQLLSNARYTVMLDADGAGFSQWNNLAVTRWREAATSEGWGVHLLLRDEESGESWPAGRSLAPETSAPGAGIEAGCIRFSSDHDDICSELDVAVAPDADIELRRLVIHNRGDRTRQLSLTSYAELVLGPIGGDNAHPAFSKMFVQTDWDAEQHLLLGTRRRRSDDEATVWAAQALRVQGQPDTTPDYETDRARFIGRTHTLRTAAAMTAGSRLSGTVGCVLDPVFAQRLSVEIAAGDSTTLLLWTQLSDSRDGALALAKRIDAPDAAEVLMAAAKKYAAAARQRYAIDDTRATRFAHWLAGLLGNDPSQRAAAEEIARGAGGPPTLWSRGISGDRPILLVAMASAADLALAEDAMLAQACWREQRVAVDVVLLNRAGDALAGAIDPLVDSQQARLKDDDSLPKAELFSLRDDAIDAPFRAGLMTVARVLLGTNATASPEPTASESDHEIPPAIRASTTAKPDVSATEKLEFANGLGGFCDHGRAYRIELEDDRHTPAPWVNVIANAQFGFMVSAEGGGYTWSINSQQNPITPWPNDPVSDTPHEVLYLRDEDSGALWSATPLPIRVPGVSYAVTHGKGWSRFAHAAHDIAVELTQCVPTIGAIKLSRLRLTNRTAGTRRLSITAYVEWALGPNGGTPAPYVVTHRDATTGAVFAQNRWRADYSERVAFADLGGQQHSISGDRSHFLGAGGNLSDPAALHGDAPLSGRLGAGLDPCAALQTRVELPPNTEIELVFLLGDAASVEEAQSLIGTYRGVDLDTVLDDIGHQWNGLLDTVQVHTPDRAMDIMLNDWLAYQVLACRVWARTAYYQSSGAFGYRDQLQDVMALCVSRPDLAREHLLRAAGRQFAEGDVQHWWLPPTGAGIRTRIRDDRVWLPHVAMHYVQVTGDVDLLDSMLPFLDGASIADGANDAFFQPSISEQSVSLYEHCALALDTSLTHGEHGLPLIGTGDWNDGMNKVGEKGRGESSWLGWFLLATLDSFLPLAQQRGDTARVDRWRDYVAPLRDALEDAWDGEWYRRGYYDDGAPLGSKQSEDCQIDTIAQSWSVIAHASDPEHAAQAMASVDRKLVDHDHGIARLFTPPFDQDGKEDPGYIKGYPPGVRENGGQYTHGAIWSVFAWAGLGDGERASELFGLLNPIHHSDSADAVERYKVEPYVVSADVYSVDPHVGRGGWTWYTGSAAWLYRAGLEAILGFTLRGDTLRIEPCIPKAWPGFELTYRHHGKQHVSRYEISVKNPVKNGGGVVGLELDGKTLPAQEAVALIDDGKTHRLHVLLG
ncbi:MAG: glycosyl transferase family 36 [Pseudomonadota bacterium]|nr:glycosyl transferase family 36 [Pseudomonadota bacterium]